MNKVLIYPYSDACKYILDKKNRYQWFEAATAIIPHTHSEGVIANNEKIKTEEHFEKEMKEHSCLWIVSSELEMSFEKDILPKVRYAVNCNKKIFCTKHFKDEEEKIIRQMVPERQWLQYPGDTNTMQFKNEIYDINIPVLYVIGLSKEINNIEQLLKIKSNFAESGYDVAVFCEEKEIEVFSDCYWLSMLSENDRRNVNQKAKIIEANHYIKQIEMETNYDLLIIGIIEGSSVLGRKIIEDFGINVYSISRAVKPDCIVLNVFDAEYGSNILKEIGKEVANVVGADIDFFNIVNKVCMLQESEAKNKICTLMVEDQSILEKVKNEKGIYCLTQDKEFKRLVNAIVDRLAEYAEIIRM